MSKDGAASIQLRKSCRQHCTYSEEEPKTLGMPLPAKFKFKDVPSPCAAHFSGKIKLYEACKGDPGLKPTLIPECRKRIGLLHWEMQAAPTSVRNLHNRNANNNSNDSSNHRNPTNHSGNDINKSSRKIVWWYQLQSLFRLLRALKDVSK